jgi:hypothetical protein
MRAATSALGSDSKLTLVDKLHIVGLIVILIAPVVAVLSRSWLERGRTPQYVQRLNTLAIVASLVLFFGINLILVLSVA